MPKKCSGKTLQGDRCKNTQNCPHHTNFAFSKSPFCKQQLQKKIKINIDEYKSGRWVSPQQAVAVSYRQTEKRFPKCK